MFTIKYSTVLLQQLTEFKTELNKEDHVAGLPGVLDKWLKNNKIELTQKALIKRITEAMCIEGMNPMATSAKTDALTMDKLADSTESSFNCNTCICSQSMQYIFYNDLWTRI